MNTTHEHVDPITSPPDTTDTTATVPTGIAGKERRAVSSNTTNEDLATDTPELGGGTIKTAGRLLAGATTAVALGLVATTAGAAAAVIDTPLGTTGVSKHSLSSALDAHALVRAKHVAASARTHTGRGTLTVTADGTVRASGDAVHAGDATGRTTAPIVGIAAATRGYWVAAADGSVFAFGGAPFLGSAKGAVAADVVAIAPTLTGYALTRADGQRILFAAPARRIAPKPRGATASASSSASSRYVPPVASPARTNGRNPIVFRPTNSLAKQLAGTPIPPAHPTVDHMHPFLVCTRAHESSPVPPAHDTGYGAVNPSGTYRGAYQFSRSTWNNTAIHAGRPDLVGVDPARASVADQDYLALDLYHWQGASPWMGRCAGL